jgi:hypothetical protein
MLMNVQMALDALREDGIKLVNIGARPLKLIATFL